MSKAQQNTVIDHIECAVSIDSISIIQLLHVIPFSEIQTFMKQQIRKCNADTVRQAYFNALSINETLPTDLMSNILSFHPFPHNTAINQTCKMWNKCSAQIKANQNKKRMEEVDAYHLNYNQTVNNTWIVDEHRTQLTNDETNSSFQGPISDIRTAIERCESGDKLLVYDGVYDEHALDIDKSIQIIGVGDNVFLTNSAADHSMNRMYSLSFRNNSISYVENITFAIGSAWTEHMDDGHINIQTNAKVIVNKCTFEHGICGLSCGSGGSLDAKSCNFTNCDFGIYVEHNASNVHVIGCVFDECGSCGYETTSSVVIKRRKVFDKQIKCIGNIFRNNLRYSITERHIGSDKSQHRPDRYSLRCNMLEGENQWIEGNEKIMDANKIYYSAY
eukprot:628125_1